MSNGWTAVDLDGTLAHYDGWKGPELEHIGEPIPLMLERVKRWLAEGRDVRIFTARACIPEQVPPVIDWLIVHLGRALPVTCAKDLHMVELWDDRAVQVEPNLGTRVDRRDLHVFFDDYEWRVASSAADARQQQLDDGVGETEASPLDAWCQWPDEKLLGMWDEEGQPVTKKTCAEWAREHGRGLLGGTES